jgi:MFS family permease
VGLLLAFGTYAVGFVARPLGGVLFGHFGDRVGRKKMLVLSLLLMGAATFIIGLLPTYATVGVLAPVLLVACRLVQGFAVGGEWGGAVLMAAEHGDDSRRGFWSSWPQAGVPAGNLMSAFVLWLLAAVQSPETFLAWGWRVPFLFSAVLVLIGLWVRLALEESPVFAEAKAARDASTRPSGPPILEVLRSYRREVAIAMSLRVAENIGYYMFSIVVLTYLVTYRGMPRDVALIGVLVGSAVQLILTPLVGALSDRLGRRPLYLAGALGTGAWGFVFFPLVDTGDQLLITLAIIIGLGFTTLMYAPQAAFFSELFGTSVRYTGASLASQLASVFAGGLAPLVAVALLGSVETSNTLAVSIYLAVASSITFIGALAAKETARTSLHHDRTRAIPAQPVPHAD